MPSPCVLDEDDALELLAFLVTAAHRLGEMIGARASAETSAAVTAALAEMPPLAVPRDDRADYVARLDDLCRAVAAHLVVHFGVTPA